MSQIVINNLSKKYGKNEVFKNINMILESKYYNFLIGENGSGKSTLIKCILDEVKYDGSIDRCGFKFSYAPEKIILPEYVTLSNFLTLLILSKTNKLKNTNDIIDYYLKIFNITKYKNHMICELSKGTKQKIVLIQTLMANSDVYIFDEPLSGLDEVSRINFIEELRKLKRQSKIIIISTHHLKQYNFKYKKIFSFPLTMEASV